MHEFRLLLIAGALLLVVPATAAPHFLDPAKFDVGAVLPPPPAEGSVRQKDEIAELDRIVGERSAEALARAISDDRTEDPSIFGEAIGPAFDLTSLPATAKLLDDVTAEGRYFENAAKKLFMRNRPWLAEPDLKTCAKRGGDHTSYPSGHATMGFSAGATLAALMPDRAQAILARARDYAESRVICGMHYRSDVVAGEVLGTTVARELLSNAAYRREFEAAESELKAAGLAH